MKRRLQLLFWAAFATFIAWDVTSSSPIDRFSEPPLIAAGSGTVASGGHCSATPR